MLWPPDPIAAATHPDPYPYYASLVAESPWYFDSKLQMWIASGAAAVKAVMSHSLCETRPVAEKIPRVLQNTPAAPIFRHLIRMNDGAEQQQNKKRVSARLAEAEKTLVPHARRIAASLWSRHENKGFHEALTAFQFDFSVYCIGHQLGFSESILPTLALWIRDFVACLSPQSRYEQIQAGIDASGPLLDLFRKKLDGLAANGIGLLAQAYEATAGLISNTCLALARGASQDLPALIRDTLRLDPPVQNTRRFLVADTVIEGSEMRSGDGILLLLAAANRDSAPTFLSFGSGVHQCPGESLSLLLALTAIEHLRTLDHDFASLMKHFHYRPSGNTRIALFHNP